jgi:peptidoglycan/LPS O-acetylase OafA/YrhL
MRFSDLLTGLIHHHIPPRAAETAQLWPLNDRRVSQPWIPPEAGRDAPVNDDDRNRRSSAPDPNPGITASTGTRTLTDKTSNYLTVQALRGIAALMVVLTHAFGLWGERLDATAPGVLWNGGAAGVDIFFVISGFVMVIASRRLNGPRASLTFLRHRFIRIVPLYWLLTTAKVVVMLIIPALIFRTTLSFDFVFKSYLFLPTLDVYGTFRPIIPMGWTLTFEFMFYFLFALALAARADQLRVLVPSLGIISALALFRTPDWPDWTVIFDTIVIEFIFGVLLARWTLGGYRMPYPMATVFLVGGLSVLLLSMPLAPQHTRFLIWGLPALAVVAGAVSLEPVLGPKLPRGLLAIGDASYSIYLSHGFVLSAVILVAGKVVLPNIWTESSTIVTCLAACVMAGWLIYISLERPMLHLMGYRRDRASRLLMASPSSA